MHAKCFFHDSFALPVPVDKLNFRLLICKMNMETCTQKFSKLLIIMLQSFFIILFKIRKYGLTEAETIISLLLHTIFEITCLYVGV